MVLGLSEWLRLPGEAGCVRIHNTQRTIESHCDPWWSVCRGSAEGGLQQGSDWCGETLSRRSHLKGDHGRMAICSQEQLSGGLSPVPVPKHWAPEYCLGKQISLSFSAAFNTPGSKLQAVDDYTRLAPGNSELHEDTTVSFQPGSEQTQPGDGHGDRKLVSKRSVRLVRPGMEGCPYVRVSKER